MYYLKKGLKQKGMGGLGKVLAVIFAIFVIGGSFGGGNMFQSNQAAAQFVKVLNLEGTSAAMWFGGIFVPVFGAPLRFIYASNLDPLPNDNFESFQFSIGSTF